MKIDEGRAMAVSSKNFDDGMILPRATPARSGTRHSISVMPRAAAHLRAWATLAIGVVSAGAALGFLDIGWSSWTGAAARRQPRQDALRSVGPIG